MNIIRDKIILHVELGHVTKMKLKETLGIQGHHDWQTALKKLCENEKFNEGYTVYRRSWKLPEWMALDMVKHFYPDYDVEVKIGVA